MSNHVTAVTDASFDNDVITKRNAKKYNDSHDNHQVKGTGNTKRIQ